MSDDGRKPGWATWATVAIVGALLLYVLSSGPTRMSAFHVRVMSVTTVKGELIYTTTVDVDDWWRHVYAPLVSVSQHPRGAPLEWYWNRFPMDIDLGN